MFIVFGTRDGREYEFGQYETESEAVTVKKREERNGYYSDITIRDQDAWSLQEHRKLPQDELEALAKRGDPNAREALAAGPLETEEEAV